MLWEKTEPYAEKEGLVSTAKEESWACDEEKVLPRKKADPLMPRKEGLASYSKRRIESSSAKKRWNYEKLM
jgi:hypothetical protein